MRARGTSVLVALVLVVSACGAKGGASAGANPRDLLTAAKATIDRAQGLHFALEVTGASGGSGTTITGGSGDLGRPDQLDGSFSLDVAGFRATVPVKAGGGRFFAEIPPSTTFVAVDPASFGVANPARLISADGGLSSLLTETQNPSGHGQTRLAGTVVDVVEGTLPGRDLTVIPDAVPSRPVAVRALIDPSSHQLRQITLTGPIQTTGSASYTLTLTRYGEHVAVALPAS